MAVVREAYGFVHADTSKLKEVYGGPTGQVFVECMRVRPETGESKTVILFSHPVGGGAFLPLVTAIALTWLVIQLPTDPGMYEPAKAAFPIILGQSWRLMIAGICAYGVSMTLNVLIFDKLASVKGRLVAARGAVASVLSQIVDTMIFITVGFLGVRPIGDLILGQALAKVVLSIVFVPLLIMLFVRLAKRWG